MSNKRTISATKEVDNYEPFGTLWLDSAYQETLLSNGPWQTMIYRLLCDHLAQSISRQLDIPERRQIIFELVGQEFVLAYFPNSSYDPQILDALAPEARKKLDGDARRWLSNSIQKAASATGCQFQSQAELSGKSLSAEMLQFIEHTKQIMKRGLDRHLYRKENELIKKWEKLHWKEHRTDVAQHEASEYANLRHQYSRVNGIMEPRDAQTRSKRNRESNSSFSTALSSRNTPTTQNVKGALFGSSEDPPLFWGIQSNSIGRSVMAILKRDPRRLSHVMRVLHGRQLPGSLRSYVWLDVLMKSDRDRLKDSNTEKILREQFAKGIKRGISELRIKDATNSPINGLICKTVAEIALSTPAMAVYKKDDAHVSEASRALNVYYVYNRIYEPSLVHCLFPLQLALQDGTGEADHAYELAMFLDMLNRNFLPGAPEIFAVAESAMSKVKAVDLLFYNHLKEVAKIKPTINPKEFLVHLIHTEKSKSEELLAAKEGSVRSIEMSRKLTDPLIFLRKWLGEGFVGVLDTQAVIYVWDQLFLQRWAVTVAEDVCLALLFLLRNKFMESQDYSSMKQVFFQEPCKLLTMDLQRAWIHIQEHRDLRQIPSMNRMSPGASPVLPYALDMSLTPLDTVKPLDAAGIKIVGMDLIFPADSIAKMPELANLELSGLRVLCTVYFGSVELDCKPSISVAMLKYLEQDNIGGKKYVLAFEDEKMVFAGLDLSKYDLEQELGSFPKAVFEIKYTAGDTVVPLGWAEVDLYRPIRDTPKVPDQDLNRRTLIAKENVCQINSGLRQNDATRYGETGFQYDDLIGNGSIIYIHVFHPVNEESRHPDSDLSPTRSLKNNSVRATDAFELHIDAVTNVPDSASIIKVTGRFINSGEVDDIPDILALPDISSSARNPHFSYRLIVNEARRQMNHMTTLLLRVYTVTIDRKELVVVGNCMFDIFDQKKGVVRLGCFARALHRGLPQTSDDSVTGHSLDSFPRIPAMRIFFRLLRATEGSQPDHLMVESDYKPIDGPFTETELRILESYSQDLDFPRSIKDAADLLQHQDTGRPPRTSPDAEWMKKKLDRNLNLPQNVTPGDLEIARVVKYRKHVGVYVQLARAYRLPERYVIHCAAFLSLHKSDSNYSDARIPFCLHTSDFDVDSPQRSPEWRHQPAILHPDLHGNACLLVLLYGLDVKYLPEENHSSPGKLVRADGQAFTVLDDICIGWTFLPIFQGLFVNSAEHHLPVFKGKPSQFILRELQTRNPESVLKDLKKQQTAGTVVVNVWDGHFIFGEWPEILRRNNNGGMDDMDMDGTKISQFILNALNERPLSSGLFNVTYAKEKELFKMAVKNNFDNLLKNSNYAF